MANNQNKKLQEKLQVQRLDSNRKLEQLIEYLRDRKCIKFTGYIKINFTQGQIGRIEKFEEILKN